MSKPSNISRRQCLAATGLFGLATFVGAAQIPVATSAAYKDKTHARSEAIPANAGPPFAVGVSKNSRMVDTGMGVGNDGNVYVWGLTFYEINGDIPTSGWQKPPQKVAGIPDGIVRQATGQIYNANALDKDGTVWGWGSYNFRDGTDAPKPNGNAKQVRINTAWNGSGAILDKIIAISSTEYAGAGIRSDGTIWHWGYPLGYGGNAAPGASQLAGLPDPSVAGNRPIYLKGAYTNFFLILERGDVYYWGGIGGNSLPSGLLDTGATPRLVSPLAPWFKRNVAPGAPYIVAVDGGINMGGALLSNGQVLSWGTDASRTGRGPTTTPTVPTVVPSLSQIKSMQFGFTGVALLNGDGELWGYGASDDYGQFPQNPTRIDTGVVQYGSGQGFYLWQKSDGSFWGRGYNPQGAIGLPSGTQIANRKVSWDLGMVTK
ncbi:hypothetical protein [Arthrobacter bambusae]|uniref:Alpha-tubulin suppressor-like RCC1 family protein n=1 Tax=Arthrobacter bambusae TaxID=1338426 RepID=A0AAW8DJ19_9MICC|nr:hypothetical protein [Arthrobacter bambusae]MDP9905701.1 alpha-tubulin suppressor-like RCC1 family protein [Arthrobacter bambusae]MDQ0130288.1 alpha-tubulin suppressor-like RCC1 family protein [Arthrobacter bambusae]MDQ0181791.1 alpha-tubulin suppressor-like RCC1 family protein [Arthrobacter bambusae]